MKKILKEWQNYLKETERKHPERDRRVSHDRAATKYRQQTTLTGGDPRSELKYYVANITYYAADSRSLVAREQDFIHFINDSESKQQLIHDLKLIHYLLEPKQETKYIARSLDRNMMIFDDTGPLSPDSAHRIEYILKDLGEQPIAHIPSDDELKEVFYYYIAPTNQAFWPEEKETEPEPPTDFMKDMFGSMFKDPEPPKTDRFAHTRNIDSEMQRRMDKLEREREARIAASKLKRRR
jgi:hypothetical protein